MSTSPSPNVLLITVDQMRYPCFQYRDQTGFDLALKEVLGFRKVATDNAYAKFFPGLMSLRKNSVVFDRHTIATSACVPSRGVIYTGQYGTKTGVEETDSLFKLGSNHRFPWLDPEGIPTMGDWFRSSGYSTHYFGKWDLSYADGTKRDGWDNVAGSLEPWGFSDWETSAPDAQGGAPNELGVYRDPGYADLVTTFLKRKAMNYAPPRDGSAPKPWMAVASLVNPHDIASAYPRVWEGPEGIGVQTLGNGPAPIPVPDQGALSNPMQGGTMRVPLNPDGFPQENFQPPETLEEDLGTKPDCQLDYAYKMGLALRSRRRKVGRKNYPMPFQLQENNNDWFTSYGQFYGYLHYLVDQQIHRIVETVHASGLAENTVIVFLADHGEYGGSHQGMIEKWHTAYDEILHVPLVVSSPLWNPNQDEMIHINSLTSHIDVLPTMLGLAGINEQQAAFDLTTKTTHDVEPLLGVDLSKVIEKKVASGGSQAPGKRDFLPERDGSEREGVLFITDDTITDILHPVEPEVQRSYEYFHEEVKRVTEDDGIALKPGSVCQPNHIRCVRTYGWKLARYFDPAGTEADQWEMYYLAKDGIEQYNLLSWDGEGNPVIRDQPEVLESLGLTAGQVSEELVKLQQLLEQLCQRLL